MLIFISKIISFYFATSFLPNNVPRFYAFDGDLDTRPLKSELYKIYDFKTGG